MSGGSICRHVLLALPRGTQRIVIDVTGADAAEEDEWHRFTMSGRWPSWESGRRRRSSP
jgi:hypothetical protein